MVTRYLTASATRAGLACLCALAGLTYSSTAQAATEFLITGAGNGHGIGMSQYGAYGDALHGWSYEHILGHYYQGTGLRQTDPGQTVRVLLGTGASGNPAFTGASTASAPRSGSPATSLVSSQTYSVKALPGGNVALYDATGHQLLSVRPPLAVTGPGPIEFAGHGQYRGSLEFRWDSGLHVQTVNAVDLEDYVRGVVAAEMPASWSTQALDAQAVAARTYALTTSVAGNGYGLYSDTRSQMYGGVTAETPSTDAAVQATRGQVVTLNGQPVVTYFFASSGGHTESIQNVWSGSPAASWLRGVADPYDNAGGNPYYRWSVSLGLGTASADLGQLVKGTLRGIEVTQGGTSPRVVRATVVGSDGSTPVTGAQLQGIFGLMSTWMSFATISTKAELAERPAVHVAFQARLAGAPAARALALHGSVFPAPRGAASLVVQRLAGRHWVSVAHGVPVNAGGAYDVSLPVAGRYRVVYRGADGPAVSVG